MKVFALTLIVLIAEVLSFSCATQETADLASLVDDAEYSDDIIVLPEIRLDSEDAKKANDDLRKLCESWREWRLDGITIKSSYSAALRDGLLSVLVTETFDDGVSADNTYHSYMFSTDSGQLVKYKDFIERFGVSDDAAEFYIKQTYAKLAMGWKDEDFMPYQTLRGALSQTLKSYSDSVETGYISFYFDESSTPYISVMTVTPQGSREMPVALVPGESEPLLRGSWVLDAGDRLHRLTFDGSGRLTVTVTDDEGNLLDEITADYTAVSDGTELILHYTSGGVSYDVRLTGTFVNQFIVTRGVNGLIVPGEYTCEEPELSDEYLMY